MRSRSIHAKIVELESSARRAVLVTVVGVTGSTPREPGARMLVFEDTSIVGTIGGGRVEQTAIETATSVFLDERPRLVEHQLTQELGMCCGGSVTLFFEVIGGQPKLLVFGAGHVGTALTKMASHAGFAVHVADERDELLNVERLAEARALYDDLNDPALPFSGNTYVMITTHDHALDQKLVEKALKNESRWIGLIGSMRKATLTRQRLAQKGFDEADIQRVRSPVGLAIGAETPEEIAVSILGELVTRRRRAVVHTDNVGAMIAPLETKKRT